ncbi:cytochrome oxidase assembly protein-domain-containing protein [Gaertneriomyces semiglobifer]|nr:cytochrome oxidase assembly protein-domain-containing protein [Gaertneriomyces semiglobifer]
MRLQLARTIATFCRGGVAGSGTPLIQRQSRRLMNGQTNCFSSAVKPQTQQHRVWPFKSAVLSRLQSLQCSSFSSCKSSKQVAAAVPEVDHAAKGSDGAAKPDEKTQHERTGNEEEISKPIVGWWYLFSGSLVFGIVALGGFTRLTGSGLSIVEWNLIKGMRPPRSAEEWDEEFEKYKQFPEYKLLNHQMTLSEFKSIFYMEWAHRMMGRFIGLSFIIPGAYFAYKGYMSKFIRTRSLIVAALIGGQGVLGWFMVKSGLSEEIMRTPHAVPRVSHYWLAAHLGSAFAIYSMMLVTGLDILRANKEKMITLARDMLKSADVRRFARYAHGVAGLVFLTAMSGAFVAGMDAGLIYNEFPKMGEGLVPSDMWAFSTKTERNPNPAPFWKDLLENPSALQFNHRVLAMSTATAISGLWLYSRRVKLPRNARLATNALLAMVGVQVGLGISTLLYFVPTPLAAAHQSGSLTLLSIALWLMQALRYVRR